MGKREKKTEVIKAQEVIEQPYVLEMKQSYLDYGMSVILSRAIPDVRDGLKPVHRRILFGMHQMGVTHDKPYRKSARIVGQILGLYHPHGDSSVYDAMVRLTQWFKINVPLVDGHGNFGSIDGDSPAAMRYTEARLSEHALYLLQDIEKSVVEMKENFDGSELEPVVLPALIPQLYMNGVSGIAVGMSTEIPPHNAGELIDAILVKMKNPKATLDELLEHVKGPDYPTGAMIINKKDLRSLYETGMGKAVIRSKIEEEPSQYGRTNLVVTEIPFPSSGSKEKLINKIIELVRDKKLSELTDVRDESSQDGIRIVLEVRKGVDLEKLRHKLYRMTPLQDEENYKCLALVNGKPEVLSLNQYINVFLEYQREIYTKRFQYLLPKAEKRKEILEGLLGAIPVIEPIIEVVRGSKDTKQMKTCLMSGDVSGIQFNLKKNEKIAKGFSFTERQAQAILDMKLQRLGKLENLEIEREYDSLVKEITSYKEILLSEKKLNRVIQKTLVDYKKKNTNERKTTICNMDTKVIPKEINDIVVELDSEGYIKCLEGTKDNDDSIKQTFDLKSDDSMVVFTSDAMAVQVKVTAIPKGRGKDKGKPLQAVTTMNKNEKPILVVPKSMLSQLMLLFVTSKGSVKRVPGEEFMTNRTKILSHKLDESEKIISVSLVNPTDDILMVSSTHKIIKFKSEEIPVAKRNSKGVIAMMLKEESSIEYVEPIVKESDINKTIEVKGVKIKVSALPLSKRGRAGKQY